MYSMIFFNKNYFLYSLKSYVNIVLFLSVMFKFLYIVLRKFHNKLLLSFVNSITKSRVVESGGIFNSSLGIPRTSWQYGTEGYKKELNRSPVMPRGVGLSRTTDRKNSGRICIIQTIVLSIVRTIDCTINTRINVNCMQ